jgi:hypothetical protein
MFENLRFMVIEDKDIDRNEVLDRLADAKFTGQNLLSSPANYSDAKEDLERYCSDLDIVFLDLNLPINQTDAFPEKGHGRRLLQMIHRDLNCRPGVDIKVVIISGEDLLDGWNDKNLYALFPGTLASICHKTALDVTLKASFKRLKKDPLLSRIKKADIPIIDDYKTIFAPETGIESRLECARRIAIQLVRNEVNCFYNDPLKSEDYADNLNGLIHDFIEDRFEMDQNNRRQVKQSQLINSNWCNFLWRGAMLQHLYTINSYRNIFIHINERPYQVLSGGTWQPDQATLARCEEGVVIGKMMGDIIREIIEWYLPWHETIYLPWKVSNPS